MIGSLRGTLAERRARGEHAADLLVEAGPVGYRVVTSAATAALLGEIGTEVRVHVHTHVREDAIVLYGFGSGEERACFEALIAAHGVGPGLALTLLAVHSPRALRHAVATDDLDALTMVPGIGKKTAARLIIELKQKLDADLPDLDVLPGGAAPGPVNGDDPDGAARRRDVRQALEALGYGSEEIRTVLPALPPDGAVEDLIRTALRELAAAR
jgi:Holliday junction DNA helicase RuvA